MYMYLLKQVYVGYMQSVYVCVYCGGSFSPDKRGGHPQHSGNRSYNTGSGGQVPYQYHSKPRASYPTSGGQRWSEQRREKQEERVKGEVSQFTCRNKNGGVYLPVVSHKSFMSPGFDQMILLFHLPHHAS